MNNYSITRWKFGANWCLVNLFSLIVIFLTYRSFNHNLFYFNWVAGALICFMFYVYLMFSNGIMSKYIFKSTIICTLWLIWALVITFVVNIVDTVNHLKTMMISTYYVLASVAAAYFILNGKYKLENIVTPLAFIWTIVNLCLLFLFLIGIYVPKGRDFSGVFHDRNVFSITSLLVMAFILGTGSSKYNKIFLFINTIMIFISQSVTGFIGLFVLFFTHYRVATAKISLKHTLIFFVLFVFFCGICFIDNPLKGRIDKFIWVITGTGDTASLHEKESAVIRFYLYQNGLLLVKDNWLFGVGLDNARYYVMWPGRNTGSFLHNTYLDIATSGGILLFLAYYLPIIFTFFYLRKKYKVEHGKKRQLCITAYYLIIIKLLADCTWTTYFEYGIVFATTFSICVMMKIREENIAINVNKRISYLNNI